MEPLLLFFLISSLYPFYLFPLLSSSFFFPHFSFLKMEGITDCFFLIFSCLFLSGKELIFSLFSSLVLPSSRNEKEGRQSSKTGIASFSVSLCFLQSLLVFALLFFLFFNLKIKEEKGSQKREFIPSYFHFSFLLENETKNCVFFSPHSSSSFREENGNGTEEKQSFFFCSCSFSFSETEEEMRRRRFFIPYSISFQGIGGGNEEKRKRKAGKTPGYRPIVGITDP